ncbi:anthranilate phosphoribosyltransferase [uncultured bacterium]|nr:anthranilate phosphoribosyltransferase [uncultured bacterium]
MQIQHAIQTLLSHQDLNTDDMKRLMRLIMRGEVTDAQLAGFLIALRCKGETIDEIAASAQIIRELAHKVDISGDHVIDTCGTGGDGADTFNISTCSAFVVAAAGGTVAKHGNRSVSSRCGSADVLEAAGINLNLSAAQVAQCVKNVGVGFLFAPNYHGAMRYTSKVRKELGVRTLFNLLGPLANPANAPNQLIGVYAPHWVEPLAHVLKKLGSHHVMVVNAEDGLDEISIAAPTNVAELKDNSIATYTITPEQFGLKPSNLAELAVKDAQASLTIMQSVFNNEDGAAKDIVLLNAGAAIYTANLCDSLATGIEKAREVIANGAALAKFEALIDYSNFIQNNYD